MTQPWRRYVLPAAVLGMLALGAWFRLDGITGSLWIDEFGTFWAVEGDFGTVFRRTQEFHGQSPFYYLLTWIPVHAFGESEITLRSISLLSNCFFVIALYACGRILVGPTAGLYAAAMGWFSTYSIAAGIEARPYALTLFGLATAIAGFSWAVRSGRWPARGLWILGGASVAWAHYVHYPLIVGLFAAYAMVPDLRLKYTPRRFLIDGVVQGALVALCLPQVLALLARQGTLSWMDEARPFVFVWLLLPLLPALALGLGLRESGGDRAGVALRRSLWICLVCQVATLQLLALAGTNLLNVRYFLSILVPGILLASVTLARLGWREAAGGLIVFAIMSGGELVVNKSRGGTFSGVGHEDWRGAVSDLAGRLRNAPDPPMVFFRSGLVEEDVLPLGKPSSVTLSPLRSPGRSAFEWPVTSLSYRWKRQAREAYFESTVGPAVQTSSHFFLLSAAWSPELETYIDQFVRWVEATWPGRFQFVRTSYGGVELFEFKERPGGHAGG